ncbi:stage II sporulation protein P [Romboutsia maritimum]|uniref:Stage II sporulation protein P n=1 Tax=Romboutsia maritimum TaxID=2020948 RepID=A0A371IU16_9FIRM|nr:stage II sporulation protein P [Romboutsia maritimum]RDY23984.1 stage II sporulation protein P [Romboutsia maritimum]
MFKKRIKAITTACVLICILPSISYSINKEEFMRFLINSSYPESSKKESEDISQNNNKKENNSSINKKENKKDYIKVYVGEENIPKINSNSPNEEQQITDSQYKDDLLVTNKKPRILIYHTHGCETYSNSPEGNYHSKDKTNSVMSVGNLLTTELSKKGWGVVHSTKYHDYPSYNSSYQSSLKTIQEIIPKYNSIDIAIDLHRDGRDLADSSMKKSYHDEYTTTINGERVAKFLFVIGARNTNASQIKTQAQNITDLANKKYPGIALPLVEKKYGKYNQFVAKNHMLIEVGSNSTSIQESRATAKYIASVLDEYFKQNQ